MINLPFSPHDYLYLEGEHIYFNNGKCLGDIVMDVDGTYLFFPAKPGGGGWPDYVLAGLGAILYEMNLPYQVEVEDYFANQTGDSDGVD
jgi:hypothetical protein